MKNKIKLLIIFLVVVFAVLIVNEFVLFTSSDNLRGGVGADCLTPSLENNVHSFDYIVLGTAKSSEWVTYKREVVLSNPQEPISPVEVIDGEVQGEVVSREFIKTDTVFNINQVLKGDISSQDIIISVGGGCNVRRNFCEGSSNSVFLEEGKDYLLFLYKLPKEGFVAPLPITDSYGGFDSCFGVYPIKFDSEGNVPEDTILFLDVTYKDLIEFLEEQ